MEQTRPSGMLERKAVLRDPKGPSGAPLQGVNSLMRAAAKGSVQKVKTIIGKENKLWARRIMEEVANGGSSSSSLPGVVGPPPAEHVLFQKDTKGRMAIDWAVMLENWSIVEIIKDAMSALSRVYQEAVKETQAAREAVAVVDKNEALHQEVLRAVEVTNHDAIKGLQQVQDILGKLDFKTSDLDASKEALRKVGATKGEPGAAMQQWLESVLVDRYRSNRSVSSLSDAPLPMSDPGNQPTFVSTLARTLPSGETIPEQGHRIGQLARAEYFTMLSQVSSTTESMRPNQGASHLPVLPDFEGREEMSPGALKKKRQRERLLQEHTTTLSMWDDNLVSSTLSKLNPVNGAVEYKRHESKFTRYSPTHPIDYRFALDAETKDGWTALSRAVVCNNFDLVVSLVFAGADPNLETRLGHTAFTWACHCGYSRMVEFFCSRGCLPSFTTARGRCALHLACERGNGEVVAALLEASALSGSTQTEQGAFGPETEEEESGSQETAETKEEEGEGEEGSKVKKPHKPLQDLRNLLQFRDGHGRLPHQAALAGKDSSSPAEVEIVLSLLKEAEDRIAYHDAVLKRIELDETPVKCTQGCGWTGKEIYRLAHEKAECQKRVVPCPRGCPARLVFETLQEHLFVDCPLRILPCRNHNLGCPVRLPAERLPRHEEGSCHWRRIPCILGCGVEVRKDLLQEHMTKRCSHYKVPCGDCGELIRTGSMNRHLLRYCKRRLRVCRHTRWKKVDYRRVVNSGGFMIKTEEQLVLKPPRKNHDIAQERSEKAAQANDSALTTEMVSAQESTPLPEAAVEAAETPSERSERDDDYMPDLSSESDSSYLADAVLDSDDEADSSTEDYDDLTAEKQKYLQRKKFIDVAGGCHCLVPHEEMEAHMLEECVNRPISCRYCGVPYCPPPLLAAHETSACLLRPLQCTNMCGATLPAKDMQHHLNSVCPLRLLPCSNGCGAQVHAIDQTWHERSGFDGPCHNRLHRCPYDIIGKRLRLFVDLPKQPSDAVKAAVATAAEKDAVAEKLEGGSEEGEEKDGEETEQFWNGTEVKVVSFSESNGHHTVEIRGFGSTTVNLWSMRVEELNDQDWQHTCCAVRPNCVTAEAGAVFDAHGGMVVACELHLHILDQCAKRRIPCPLNCGVTLPRDVVWRGAVMKAWQMAVYQDEVLHEEDAKVEAEKIAKAQVRCSLGCGATMTAEAMEKHESDDCPKREIGCSLGCGTIILADQQQEHRDTVCPEQLVACEAGCSERIRRGDLERHRKFECINRLISCKWGCGATIQAKHIEDHERIECELREVTCPLGCNARLKQRDVEAHTLLDCSKQLQPCRFGCGGKVLPENQAEHEKVCFRRPVSCPRNCGLRMWETDLASHLHRCPYQILCCGSVSASFANDCIEAGLHSELPELRAVVRSRLTLGNEFTDEDIDDPRAGFSRTMTALTATRRSRQGTAASSGSALGGTAASIAEGESLGTMEEWQTLASESLPDFGSTQQTIATNMGGQRTRALQSSAKSRTKQAEAVTARPEDTQKFLRTFPARKVRFRHGAVASPGKGMKAKPGGEWMGTTYSAGQEPAAWRGDIDAEEATAHVWGETLLAMQSEEEDDGVEGAGSLQGGQTMSLHVPSEEGMQSIGPMSSQIEYKSDAFLFEDETREEMKATLKGVVSSIRQYHSESESESESGSAMSDEGLEHYGERDMAVLAARANRKRKRKEAVISKREAQRMDEVRFQVGKILKSNKDITGRMDIDHLYCAKRLIDWILPGEEDLVAMTTAQEAPLPAAQQPQPKGAAVELAASKDEVKPSEESSEEHQETIIPYTRMLAMGRKNLHPLGPLPKPPSREDASTNDDPSTAPLHEVHGYAANTMETQAARISIRHGKLQKCKCHGDTPLIRAAKEGHTELVYAILPYLSSQGIDDENRMGLTPMIIACRYARIPIVSALLDRGADINYETNRGYFPLLEAVKAGNLELVKLLIHEGADPLKINRLRQTGEQVAKQMGYTEIAKFLHDKTIVSIDVRECFTAVARGYVKKLKFILKGGEAHRPGHVGMLTKEMTALSQELLDEENQLAAAEDEIALREEYYADAKRRFEEQYGDVDEDETAYLSLADVDAKKDLEVYAYNYDRFVARVREQRAAERRRSSLFGIDRATAASSLGGRSVKGAEEDETATERTGAADGDSDNDEASAPLTPKAEEEAPTSLSPSESKDGGIEEDEWLAPSPRGTVKPAKQMYHSERPETLAIARGQYELIKKEIQERKVKVGRLKAEIARKRGALHVAKILAHRAASGHTLMTWCAAYNQVQCLPVLMKYGGSPSIEDDVLDASATLIQAYVWFASPERSALPSVIERFANDASIWLSLRAEVKRRRKVCRKARTALVECAFNGNVEYFEALLDAGASIWAKSYVMPIGTNPYSLIVRTTEHVQGHVAYLQALDHAIDCVTAAQLGRMAQGSKGWIHGAGFKEKTDNIMSKKNAARNLKKQAELQQELFDAMKAYDFPTMLKLIVDGASASEADEFGRSAFTLAAERCGFVKLGFVKELYGRVYEPPLHDSTSIQKAITKGFTFVDEDVRKANESSSFAKGTRRNSVVGRQRRRSSVGINAAQVGQGVVPREESKEGQSSNPFGDELEILLVSLLLDRKRGRPRPDNETPAGHTALIRAAGNSHVLVCDALVTRGASVNYQTRFDGSTALMHAAGRGQLEMVHFLCDKGADSRLKDKTGRTAWDWAESFPEVQVYIAAHQSRNWGMLSPPTKGPRKLYGCRYSCGACLPSNLLREHEERECPKRPVTCTIGCGAVLWASELKHHETSECPVRQALCPNLCGAVVIGHKLDTHLAEECPKRMVKCPYGCPARECAWEDMEVHRKERCEYRRILCELGCRQEIPLPDLADHKYRRCPKRLIRCPRCAAEFRAEHKPDHDGFQCPYREVQCKWSGCGKTGLAMEIHGPRGHENTECQFREELCPRGCGEYVLLPELENHLTKECPFRLTLCPQGCKRMVQHNVLSKHYELECLRTVVRCPREGCVERLQRRKLQEHLDRECGLREVVCSQCSKLVTLRDLLLHKQHECDGRRIQCPRPLCRRLVQAGRLQHHLTFDCKYRTRYCRLGCGKILHGKDLGHHERRECDFRWVTCPRCAVHIKAMDRKFHDEVECTVPEAKVDFQHMMRISAGASREGAREVLEELKAKATGIPHRPLLTLLSGFPNIPKTGVSLVSDGSSEEDDKG